MSTYLQSYRTGTASVANASTAVTGTLTLWTANVQPGDRIVIGATEAEVASVESNTALTLVSAWAGTTATGAAYTIHRWSKGWSAAGTTALLLSLYESNRPTFIPVSGDPSNAVGADGNIAVDWTAGLMYQKTSGVWGTGVAFRTRPRGAYSSGTNYAVGDIVTNQSASWIALVATIGNAPPALPTESNTQWTLISKSGALTPSGTITADRAAIWVDGVSVKSTNDIRVTATGVGIKADPITSVALAVGGKIDVGGTLFLNGADYSGWSTFWSAGALYFATPYGYLGVNGSTRLGLFWNGYRNNASGWTSLGQGGGTPDIACAIEMGASGIDFSGDTPTVSGVTPTLRARITPDGKLGIGTAAPTATIDNNGDTYRQRTARTPASATAAGNAGDHCWDASYLYVCTATNTWKRAALSTW